MCGLQGGFKLKKREQQCIDYIRRTVGLDNFVLMLISGGADFAFFVLPFSIKRFYVVTTRRECRIFISITVSCKRTNPSRSSFKQLGFNLRVI